MRVAISQKDRKMNENQFVTAITAKLNDNRVMVMDCRNNPWTIEQAEQFKEESERLNPELLCHRIEMSSDLKEILSDSI